VREAVTKLRQLVTSTRPFGLDPRIPLTLRPCNASTDPADGASDPVEGPDPVNGGLLGDFPAKWFGSHEELDLATYEASVFDNFQGTVQYNNEVPVIANVAVLCESLTNESISVDPLERLAAAQEDVWYTGCQPSSFVNDSIAPLQNITFGGRGCNLGCSSARQWTWQTCMEFGWFQTTKSTKASDKAHTNPFAALESNNLQAAGGAICKALFGLDELPATSQTNVGYGGRVMLAENVTIVNGGMDPWHSISAVIPSDPYYQSCIDDAGQPLRPGSKDCPRQMTESSSTLITIPTTSHCGDMYAPNRFASAPYCPGPSCHTDLPSVVRAHAIIRHNVGRYIGKSEKEASARVAKSKVAPAEKLPTASGGQGRIHPISDQSSGQSSGQSSSPRSGGLLYFPWLRSWLQGPS
jgi:hypothetical protein